MRYVVFLLALLFAAPAWSEVWSFGCLFTTGNLVSDRPSTFNINAGNSGCYRFTIADSTSTSDMIAVKAASALWCFDSDNTDAIVDTATVNIYYCPDDHTVGSAGDTNRCIDLGGANGNTALTGATGTATTQNACIRTGPGLFYIVVSAACTKASTDYCQVSVKGE